VSSLQKENRKTGKSGEIFSHRVLLYFLFHLDFYRVKLICGRLGPLYILNLPFLQGQIFRTLHTVILSSLKSCSLKEHEFFVRNNVGQIGSC